MCLCMYIINNNQKTEQFWMGILNGGIEWCPVQPPHSRSLFNLPIQDPHSKPFSFLASGTIHDPHSSDLLVVLLFICK